MKIIKYQNSPIFGEFVRNQVGCKHSDSALQKKDLPQLNDILNKIRVHLDTKNMDTFYNKLSGAGLLTLEKTISPFYDIEGFSERTQSSEEFWNVLERFKIESDLPQIPPVVQLSFILAQNIFITHELNKLKPKQKPFEHIPPDAELIIRDIEEQAKEPSPPPPTTPVNNKRKRHRKKKSKSPTPTISNLQLNQEL